MLCNLFKLAVPDPENNPVFPPLNSTLNPEEEYGQKTGLDQESGHIDLLDVMAEAHRKLKNNEKFRCSSTNVFVPNTQT